MASYRRSDVYKALVQVLDDFNVAGHYVEHGGHHPKLKFEYHARPYSIVFAGSPSANSATKNAVGFLRRTLRRAA